MKELSDDAVLEIQAMVRSNDSHVFNFLQIYMKVAANNIFHVLDSKDLLTNAVVFTAWESGRADILNNCVRKGVPINARSSVTSAIKSGSTDTLDFCVEHGGSVALLSRPYCHCTTPEMMEHIWTHHRCMLYDRYAVFPRDLDLSIKYMEMGGTVAQMGKEMNDFWQKEGNWRRSLPVKRAYMNSVSHSNESGLAKLVLCLPKSLVNRVCEYL